MGRISKLLRDNIPVGWVMLSEYCRLHPEHSYATLSYRLNARQIGTYRRHQGHLIVPVNMRIPIASRFTRMTSKKYSRDYCEQEFIYLIEGKPHCWDCAEQVGMAFLQGEPRTFDDVYDGQVGGIQCDSCLYDFTPEHD